MEFRMKNNDEFIVDDNSEYDDDARAVNESELLPIYEAMHFSGDIQPVENVVISEYEKTSSKERGENKKTDINKKTNPIKSVLNTAPEKVIAIAVALLVAVGAIIGATVGILTESTNELPAKAVYSVGSEMQLMLDDGDVFSLSEAQEVRVSDDAMKLCYSKNTSSKTGKFDLKTVDISKRNSLKKGGLLIDNGVDEGWQMSSDGSFICYAKTVSDTKSFYLYSVADGKSQLVSHEVEEAFLPSNGDVVYFTRKTGSLYSLYRLRYGEEAQSVANGISYVNFCDSDNGFEVLYTVQTGNGTNVDVFIVKNFDVPVEICSDVSEVYANEYSYNGNLYFFTKNKSTVNWQDFIKDSYSENDVTMQRPVEGDFMIEKGFIFKRYVLDTVAYNAAKKKFEAKQHRDNIRAELDKMNLGLSVKGDYTCYVYNGLTTKKLASGIMLDNVVSYAVTEAPRMIYRKSVISVENKITMDKLMEISADGNISDAIDYVSDTVRDSYSLSNDCIYTWYDGTRVLEYSIDGYKADKTAFYLASGSVMYALTDGELYYSEISKSGLTKGTLVDTNVVTCSYEEGFMYYEKATNPDVVSLYRHSVKDSKQHLCDDLYSYIPVGENFVMLLTGQGADSELVDIGIFSDGKYTAVDTDVSLKSFVYKDKDFAYTKNIGLSEINNAGEMFIYTPEEGIKKCSDKVTRIIYVH